MVRSDKEWGKRCKIPTFSCQSLVVIPSLSPVWFLYYCLHPHPHLIVPSPIPSLLPLAMASKIVMGQISDQRTFREPSPISCTPGL